MQTLLAMHIMHCCVQKCVIKQVNIAFSGLLQADIHLKCLVHYVQVFFMIFKG